METASTATTAAIDYLTRSLLEVYLTAILKSLPHEREHKAHNAFALVQYSGRLRVSRPEPAPSTSPKYVRR